MNQQNIITIELPLPPRALHPNSRPHWGTKARKVAAYRRAAMLGAMAAMGAPRNDPPRWAKARTTATFYFGAKRKQHDADGLLAWLKAGFDGFADAGVVANDSGFVHDPVKQEHKQYPERVVILVERIGTEKGT